MDGAVGFDHFAVERDKAIADRGALGEVESGMKIVGDYGFAKKLPGELLNVG